ncbi:MAG TPA: hypothetical protein VES42_01245, partial [Pilimelia sp.]|nr:hypothetical protein [Pilimelia sp.]
MWRLARAGLRARPGQAVWQFVLGVLAIGAAVAATLYADGAAAETQRLRYASAEGADRAITIRGSVAAGGGLVQAERLADTLGAIGARAGLRAYGTVELDAATLGGAQAGSVQLVAREGACDNLRVSGRCPAAAGEALAAADVSGATGVAAGGRLLVQAPGAAPVRLRVVGTYRAGDDASAYWAGRDDFAADGRLTATPVIVQPATIVAARPKTVKVRIDLVAADPAGVSGDAGVVTDVLADVRRALPVAFTVEPGLVPLVRGAATDREVLRTGIVVGASQLVALC